MLETERRRALIVATRDLEEAIRHLRDTQARVQELLDAYGPLCEARDDPPPPSPPNLTNRPS